MILKPKPVAPGLTKRWLTACRMAALEITGYAIAIFLAEILVKIGSHQ